MVDDLGQGPQPHSGADRAASLGEQGPHLADGPGDGGAVNAEPAGEHVVGGGMPEVHERGQEPIDEHQPVLRTRAHSALPRPGRKLGLVPFVPQRAQLCDEFSDHVGRQARDPPVADDRCTRRVPHHTTMIDDQKLDASPLTVHELVRQSACAGARAGRARRRGCRRCNCAHSSGRIRRAVGDGDGRFAARDCRAEPVRTGSPRQGVVLNSPKSRTLYRIPRA